LTLFTAGTEGYLALVSARAAALRVATAVITGALGVSWLKAGFGRLRPAAGFAELFAPGLSFSSGHAGVSAIVFLTLGALLASTRSRAIERMYILAMASLMTLLVGLSRIALGVHWATDVSAGWAFGAAGAMVWLLLARRFACYPSSVDPGVGGIDRRARHGSSGPARHLRSSKPFSGAHSVKPGPAMWLLRQSSPSAKVLVRTNWSPMRFAIK
jgi:hypothetical protein